MGHLSQASKAALTRAVEHIERSSAAEVLIAVRPVSTPALVSAALGGALAGLLGLAFLLYSPFRFSHEAILVDTLLCTLFGAFLCTHFSALRRWTAPRSVREAAVDRAAKAEFLERGVHETRDRSGILVYVSQIERSARVLADRGVLASVDRAAWDAATSKVLRAVCESDDGAQLAVSIEALAPLLSHALPAREDDTNELEDGLS